MCQVFINNAKTFMFEEITLCGSVWNKAFIEHDEFKHGLFKSY